MKLCFAECEEHSNLFMMIAVSMSEQKSALEWGLSYAFSALEWDLSYAFHIQAVFSLSG